jgi:hypothetical protein
LIVASPNEVREALRDYPELVEMACRLLRSNGEVIVWGDEPIRLVSKGALEREAAPHVKRNAQQRYFAGKRKKKG